MTHIVKSFLLLFVVSLWAAAIIVTPRFARQTPAPAPRELYSVVNNQLTAFRAADFSRAYRNASTRVQQRFSLPQFERMIRRNYAEMMTETQRVEFGRRAGARRERDPAGVLFCRQRRRARISLQLRGRRRSLEN